MDPRGSPPRSPRFGLLRPVPLGEVEGLPDDRKVATLPDRPDDGVPVLLPACGLVVAWEINRDRIVSALAQHGPDEVPVPGGSAAAMDQRERRHAKAALAHQLLQEWPCL
jgi:hypothetical protein